MKSRLVLGFFVIVAILAAYVVRLSTAHVNGTNIGGASVSGCGPSDCHGIAVSTTTTVHLWTDATTFTVGNTYQFHVTVSTTRPQTQNAAGCAVSVNNTATGLIADTSDDVTAAQSDLRKFGSQLTHKSPRAFDGDSTTWTFRYKPSQPGSFTIYAAGNAARVDNNATDDLWNKTSFPLTVDEPSGVDDPSDANSHLDIYPNPTSGPLVISSHDLKDAVIRISDAAGHVVLNTQKSLSDNSSLDLSNFANGVYFVQVMPKNGTPLVKRIIVQK
jgi:hypothetical protein